MHPNETLAREWIAAFNAHDVPRLVALYAADCTHTSPRIRVSTPNTGGKIIGHAALTEWWTGAMQRTPGLRYEPTVITANETCVVVEYLRHAPNEAVMPVAEVFEVAGGKITASRVYLG